MPVLKQMERQALSELRKGGMIQQETLDVLVKKRLASANPLELTEAGRIVCELLLEIETLQLDGDACKVLSGVPRRFS
jgi:hypothetical protein